MTITLRLEKDEPLTFDEVDGNFTDLDTTKADVGHTHVPTEIVGSTAAGRAMLTATDATAQTALLDAATTSLKGLMSSSDKTKLDAITGTNTGDETASGVLTKIKTVDGDGSGLDADKLDGLEATAFALASHTQAASTISDSTSAGRTLLTAATAQAQRTALKVYAYYTRSEFVTAVAGGLVGVDGTSITVAGLTYQWNSGATAISDLHGLLPATAHVDPMHFGADNTGTDDSCEAFQDALIYLAAKSAADGFALFKPSAGEYLITWDGTTGEADWGGNPATGINQRFCFLVNAASDLIFDFTGVKILLGGSNENEWATLFRFRKCKNIRVIDGVYDFVNLPAIQGTITARDAGTGVNGTITFTLDSVCPPPSFSTIRQIEPHDYLGRPSDYGMARSTFGGTPWSLTDLGAGSYQIGDLTSAETASSVWSGFLTVGSKIVVRGARDGSDWFQVLSCNGVRFAGCVMHAAISGFVQSHLSSDVVINNCKLIERPNSGLLFATMRDPIKLFNIGGLSAVTDNDIRFTGDDAIAIGSPMITGLTYVSATSFTGFMHGHWWQETLSGGEYLTLRDKQGAYLASLLVTGVSSASGHNRTFTFEVKAGSVPNPLTNCYAEVLHNWSPRPIVTGNRISKIRGRGIYAGCAGNYTNNSISDVTGQGVFVAYAISGGAVMVTRADAANISNNLLVNTCLRTFYVGAIYLQSVEQGSESGTSAKTATNYQIQNININNNTIVGTPNAAIFLGGVYTALVSGNLMSDVASVGNPHSFNNTLGANCVISIINCQDVVIADNFAQNIHSATLVKEETDNSGSNINIYKGAFYNGDASAFFHGIGTATPSEMIHVYKSADNVAALVEADSTYTAKVRLKNGVWGGSVFAGSNGLILRDETAGLNRWNMDTSGHLKPALDVTYDIGAAGARPRRVYAQAVQPKSFTVATLPTGAQGDIAMVTDANATTFNSIVAGGGSNKVPVFYDGSNWRIG